MGPTSLMCDNGGSLGLKKAGSTNNVILANEGREVKEKCAYALRGGRRSADTHGQIFSPECKTKSVTGNHYLSPSAMHVQVSNPRIRTA